MFDFEKMTLGERLVVLRKSKNLSQKEACNILKWESHSKLSNYENNVRKPDIDDLEELAAVYQIPAHELLYPGAKDKFDAGLAEDVIDLQKVKAFNEEKNAQLEKIIELFSYDKKTLELAMSKNMMEHFSCNEDTTCTLIAGYDVNMYPVIKTGDLMLIDSSKRKISDGKIYAFTLLDDFYIARLLKEANGDVIISKEANSKKIPKTAIDLLQIIGRVTAVMGAV